MKKSLIFVGLLAIGFANAQEYDGKIGINTNEPKATLDITPEASNLTGTTNEGIIAPRLTKTRIANIEANKLTEGTLVYATDAVYTAGADTVKNGRVAKINEKGYYFYNGTEWVKVQHSDTNTELWAQRNNNSITETYLKPAVSNNDEYMYAPKRSYINLGNLTQVDYESNESSPWKDYKTVVPNVLMINSTALTKDATLNTTSGNRAYYSFTKELYKVGNDHKLTLNEKAKYRGRDIGFVTKDLTFNVENQVALEVNNSIQSSNTTDALIGGRFFVGVGTDDGKYKTVATNLWGINPRPIVRKNTKVTTMTGIYNDPIISGGEITNAYGEYTRLHSSSETDGVLPTMKYTNLMGNRIEVTNSQNTTVNHQAAGMFTNTFENGSEITVQANGVITNAYIKNGAKIKDYTAFNAHLSEPENAEIDELYAFKFHHNILNNDFKVKRNMYGIYLKDINRGQEGNFAIYTNAGKIRFGELTGSGDRPVYVDSDGVLKVGSAVSTKASEIASTNAMECNAENRGKMNFIQGADGKSDVFGICMKNANGNYYWGYMVGGNNPTNGTGAFGSGL